MYAHHDGAFVDEAVILHIRPVAEVIGNLLQLLRILGNDATRIKSMFHKNELPEGMLSPEIGGKIIEDSTAQRVNLSPVKSFCLWYIDFLDFQGIT